MISLINEAGQSVKISFSNSDGLMKKRKKEQMSFFKKLGKSKFLVLTSSCRRIHLTAGPTSDLDESALLGRLASSRRKVKNDIYGRNFNITYGKGKTI